MDTDAQRLLHYCPAPATALRRAAWINLDIRAPSICRFVARRGGELIPRGIRNAFRQAVILEHPCDTHVLEHDTAETAERLRRRPFSIG
jgi:hypothetical protein